MIRVDRLVKRYGGAAVVDSLSFTCGPGSITGFLGANGAGKSTTLRLLAGLTRPTSGEALIDGRPYAELSEPARVAGFALDASSLHPGRTGIETCRLAAMTVGVPRARADHLFDLVGLDGSQKKRVRDYSLGMRQRLSIAVALMGDPSVLILDEPVNGLDPHGVRWIRDLLKDFAAGGGTVLVSSHLLNEVATTVDQLVIIDRGRLVAQQPLSARHTVQRTAVAGPRPDLLERALAGEGWAVESTDAALIVDRPAAEVGEVLARTGLVLTHLSDVGSVDLEDLFLQLTGGSGAARGSVEVGR